MLWLAELCGLPATHSGECWICKKYIAKGTEVIQELQQSRRNSWLNFWFCQDECFYKHHS